MRDDRKRQVRTTRKNHGKDFYKEIGSIGGMNSPNKFTSDSGKKAAIKRWEDYRKKLREKEGEANEQSNQSTG